MSSSSSVFRQAVSHSAYSALGTASVFLVNFLFAGLTIRFLGNEQAGFFIVIAALFSLSQAAGGLVLANPATKRAAELYASGDCRTVRTLAGSVLLVNGLIGIAVAVGCIAFFPLVFRWSKLQSSLQSEAFVATVLMAGSFLAEQAGGSLRFLYAACLRQDLRNYTLSAMGLAGGVVRIVWLACYPTMPAAATATLAVSVAWLVLDAWLVRRLLGGGIWPGWCTAEIRPLLNFSLWELFNGVGISAGNTVDRFILTTYLGSGSLPYYAIAQRFFQQIHAALAQQFSFVFPLLAATGSDLWGNIAAIQDRARWFLAALGGLLYTGVLLAGPAIIAHLVGPEFAEKARWPIYLVTVQGLAVSFVIANYFLHYSVGNGAANALFNTGSNILMIGLALVLIPRYDYLGASLAQLVVVVTAVFFLATSKRILRIEDSWTRYLSAYASPLVLFFLGAGVGKAIEFWLGPSLCVTLFALVGGWSLGLVSLLVLESTVFPTYERLRMVRSAWHLICDRLTRRNTAMLASPRAGKD